PVFAMIFGIAKGFGYEKILEKQLLNEFPGHETIMTNIFIFSQSLLENTRGDMIAGIGLALLFWMVIKVLSNIEQSFNFIWKVEENRTWARKFSDYLSMIISGSILMIMSGSLTVFITNQVTLIIEKFHVLGFLSPMIFFILKLFPCFLIWIVFFLTYVLIPNIKVRYPSAFFGGVIAGTVYYLVQWGYIYFQIGVTRYNAIYGSFAAIPLFLAWLQVSWFILLFGAEIAHVHQQINQYENGYDKANALSFLYKQRIVLLIMNKLVKQFALGYNALTSKEISESVSCPLWLVEKILTELISLNLVSQFVDMKSKISRYQPAIDIHSITVSMVIKKLEEYGFSDVAIGKSETLDAISSLLEQIFTHDQLKIKLLDF
ncbi:MAG: YihY/virulence factor BrkB family protein, partial [Desulfobacterales bacterium]|nr:YihY/virulence factor BrkB family protein [Desulfobacterales bacterium]